MQVLQAKRRASTTVAASGSAAGKPKGRRGRKPRVTEWKFEGVKEWTPLHYAAYTGDRDRLRELLLSPGQGRRDMIATDSQGLTPLHVAAGAGQVAAIEALLAAGSHLEGVDHICMPPLHWAATGEAGGTALHSAAMFGHASAIEALLAAGADPGLLDDMDWTPLDLAEGCGRKEAAEVLILAGAPGGGGGAGEAAVHLFHSYLKEVLLGRDHQTP
ncbi:hypothetical protein N2152v2_008106 [Parachlorella kessleri]